MVIRFTLPRRAPGSGDELSGDQLLSQSQHPNTVRRYRGLLDAVNRDARPGAQGQGGCTLNLISMMDLLEQPERMLRVKPSQVTSRTRAGYGSSFKRHDSVQPDLVGARFPAGFFYVAGPIAAGPMATLVHAGPRTHAGCGLVSAICTGRGHLALSAQTNGAPTFRIRRTNGPLCSNPPQHRIVDQDCVRSTRARRSHLRSFDGRIGGRVCHPNDWRLSFCLGSMDSSGSSTTPNSTDTNGRVKR